MYLSLPLPGHLPASTWISTCLYLDTYLPQPGYLLASYCLYLVFIVQISTRLYLQNKSHGKDLPKKLNKLMDLIKLLSFGLPLPRLLHITNSLRRIVVFIFYDEGHSSSIYFHKNIFSQPANCFLPLPPSGLSSIPTSLSLPLIPPSAILPLFLIKPQQQCKIQRNCFFAECMENFASTNNVCYGNISSKYVGS